MGAHDESTTAAVPRATPDRPADGSDVEDPATAGVLRGGSSSTRSTVRSVTTRVIVRSGLVDLPEVEARDPSVAVMSDPFIPEHKRFCSECRREVGRTRDGVAGSTEGFCPRDGTPFSFAPKLTPGAVVGGQYEVVGCLAHGGLGWIYLAKDRKVGDDDLIRWVVLKGLLDSGDQAALQSAIGERRFLAEVDHPSIVKIFNFVEHEGSRYIVMAYVDGVSLRELLESRNSDDPRRGRLPAAVACEYVLRCLPALSYMHERGLLYCDFKPDNVIAGPLGITLIDLGAVSRMGDEASHVYGTVGYQAPEIAQTGPTVASDLYGVARTLAVLCTGLEFAATDLPSPKAVPAFVDCDSLYRFLRKGTSQRPADRFVSADDMADQLVGVLRELVATEEKDAPGASRWFTGDFRPKPDAADWRLLPTLRVGVDDEAAPFLATIGAVGPGEQLERLELGPHTVEIDLRRAQILVGLERWDEADAALRELEWSSPGEWRATWHRGVMELARGAPGAARQCFLEVYREVPGELAPKLALGVSAEVARDAANAASWYRIVSRTDRSYVTATFGLARCLSRMGDREGSIEAYERVPDTSSAYVDAVVARIVTILAPDGREQPRMDEVREAGAAVLTLELEDHRRDELLARVLEAALQRLTDGAPPDARERIAGLPLTDREVRLGLEATYRRLARTSGRPEARIEFVDRANAVRPRTLT
jgi:serine/threonine-protein kinase PknG